jgi:VWFA-related protein
MPPRDRPALLLALVIVLVSAGLAGTRALGAFPPAANPARQGAQPPRDLVPVSIHVLDKNGKPVTDLKASDFSVLEDGLPQTVAQCNAFALTPGSASADAKLTPRQGWSAAPPDRRVFAIMVGLGRLEEPSKVITGVLQFVKTGLLPQDLVALFAYDRAIPFTTDHQRIADALERLKKKHEDLDFELGQQLGPTGMAPLYGARVISKKLQTKIDDNVVGPGAKPASPSTAEVIDVQQFPSMTLDDFMVSTATTLQDSGNLLALVEYMRRFDEEKHLLFLTEKGLLWPSEENDRALAAAANDARVSIHPLQAGGLLAAMDDSTTKQMNATVQQAESFKSLRRMSELTGGLPAILDKGSSALGRLDDMTRSGYILGYQASNRSWDGGYRNIVVRVNRPDVTVLYRHGYYRMQDAGGFARRVFITNDRLGAAANFRREVSDIKVKASVSQRSGSLAVEGKIDLAKVKTLTVDGSRIGLLNAAVYCFDTATYQTGVHVQELPIKLSEADFAKYLKDGYPYTIQFPIIRGTSNIRFVVYDFGSDLIGRTDTKLF